MKHYLGEWMNAKNLNPTTLAEKSGVSVNMICKYLGGKPTPSLEHAKILADTMDITVDQLITGADVPVTDMKGTQIINDFETIKSAFALKSSIKAITLNDYNAIICMKLYCDENNIEYEICYKAATHNYYFCYKLERDITWKDLKSIMKTKKYIRIAKEQAENVATKYKDMILI